MVAKQVGSAFKHVSPFHGIVDNRALYIRCQLPQFAQYKAAVY